jgi:DNA topoisomerase I
MDALLPPQAAQVAGLRYVSAAAAGIRRVRVGNAFRYLGPDGRAIRGRATLARIRALVIPPAWTEVWICPHDDGHLQAWGRDARRRKQYRYHERWRQMRDATKYARLAAFGRTLPRIRRQVSRDLARPGLPREKVLATLVRLLESTFVRIGNAEYARQNSSFGLTTLRERQVRVRGSQLRFRFHGKSGVLHEVAVSDERLARIVRRMQELPGEELFRYIADDGAAHAIESADVNAYLQAIAGEEFTSKDFRTWAGTLLCARALRELPPPSAASAAGRELRKAVESAARTLRNTPAVCRKCYIHPTVIESFLSGRLQQAMRGRNEEAALIRLLEKRGDGRTLQARTLRHVRRHRKKTRHAPSVRDTARSNLRQRGLGRRSGQSHPQLTGGTPGDYADAGK